jgi:hypothetical protein
VKAEHAQLNPKPFNVEEPNSQDMLLTTSIDIDDDTQATSKIDAESHRSQRRWPILATTGSIALGILLWCGSRAISAPGMNALSTSAVASDVPDIPLGDLPAPVYQEKFAVSEIESIYSSTLDDLNHARDAGHDLISNAELEEDLRLIEAIEITDLRVYFNHSHQKHPQERPKRSIGLPIPAAIDKVLHDNAFSPAFRQVLHAFSVKAQDHRNIIQAKKENKELMHLLVIIEEITLFLEIKISQNKFDNSFDETSKALQDFWKIANETNDTYAQEVVTAFKTDHLKKKWLLHKKEQAPSFDDRDLYIQSRYLAWQEHQIRRNDMVLSVVNNKLQYYSLYDLLKHKHRHSRAHASTSYHFAFDNTGLPDTQLKSFADSEHTQAFIRFTESDAYFHLKTKNMWNAHLCSLVDTPSDFQRNEEIQKLIDDTSLSPLMTEASKQGVIKKLLQLGLPAPTKHSQDISRQLVLGYAHHRLLETAPELRLFVKTDVIISFTNQFNDTEYSTIAFAELMCMHAGIEDIHLDQYENLTIHWPLPMLNKPEVKSLFDRIGADVRKFAATLELASEIKQKHDALIKEMPTFSGAMKNAMDAICTKIGITSCNLSDTISINYRRPSKIWKTLSEKWAQDLVKSRNSILEDKNIWLVSELIDTAQEFKKQNVLNEASPISYEFSYLDILKGEHRRLEIDNDLGERLSRKINRNDLSQSQKNALLDAMMNFDAQTAIIDTLKETKENPAIEAHFDDFQSLLLSQSPQKDNEELYEFTTTPLLALFIEKPFHLGEAQIRLFSRLNGQTRNFISVVHLLYQARNDPELAAFLNAHLPADFNGEFENLSVTSISANECEDLYLRTLDWHIKNADILIRSQREAGIDRIAEAILGNALLLTLPVLLMNPVTALLYTSLIFVGPRLMELANSDNQQDTRKRLSQVVEAVALQMGGAVAGKVIAATGKLVKEGISSAFESSQQELSIIRNTDGTSEDYIRDLEQEFNVSCPSRFKREGGAVRCTISNISSARKNIPKANRNVGPGQPVKQGWESLVNLAQRFFPSIKEIVAGKAKRIAEEKLTAVKNLIGSGEYEEELALGARAYLGERYDPIKFSEKISKLQKDLAKLTKDKINLSASFRSDSEAVAQLNENAFRENGKFLEINKGQFHAYYKHMGKSPSAIADLLIHEMSHATINTMDFVYIGSRQFQNAQVDVYELINLANNKLETGINEAGTSQRYLSPYAGVHLGNLQGSSADIGKMAGLQNADSITQFISLFSKATRNPEEFKSEIAQLQELSEQTNGFTERISGPVLLNRSKRDNKFAHVSKTDNLSHYLITIDQADKTVNVYALSKKTTDTISASDLPYRAIEYTNGRQEWEKSSAKKQRK